MKLAEALIERKATKERIARLKERLIENAKVQEGDSPQEDPRRLLDEADAAMTELERLTIRINSTNIRTPLVMGKSETLMDAIALRDRVALKRGILEHLVGAAGISRERGFAVTRREIKFRPTVNVAELQKEIDALAKQYRELDTLIQARNFEAELVE